MAPNRPPQDVLADVEGGLAVALDADDLDLVGELLMTPALLRLPWSPVAALAWHVFDGLWEAYGCVPSPGLDAAAYATCDGIERERVVLRDTYHTMHVAGLLCATLLATGRTPPPPAAAERDPDAGRLCDELAAERTRAWLTHLARAGDRLPPAALALALDVAARRRVLSLDLRAWRGSSNARSPVATTGGPLVVQGAGFLDRLLAGATASSAAG